MPTTAIKLQGPARRDKARKAYQMALRRVTFTEIGQALDVSRQLVSTLVSEEQERQWADRDTAELEAEKRRAIATYEEVIRGAWQRLGKIKDTSLNVSGLYNVIISAQGKIDDITGVKAQHEGGSADGMDFLLGMEAMRAEFNRRKALSEQGE